MLVPNRLDRQRLHPPRLRVLLQRFARLGQPPHVHTIAPPRIEVVCRGFDLGDPFALEAGQGLGLRAYVLDRPAIDALLDHSLCQEQEHLGQVEAHLRTDVEMKWTLAVVLREDRPDNPVHDLGPDQGERMRFLAGQVWRLPEDHRFSD